jgi:hypothetical protein
LSKEDEEAAAFQNWLWGKLHPQDFAIIWAPVSYREIGLLCGISESTVQHWFSDPTATSHREPADRHQRLLAITGWFLSTFELTPLLLVAQFEQSLQQDLLE